MTKPSNQGHYNDPGSLAASGIYTNIELENLREHIMFPAEKNGILNTMARGAKGEPTLSQGISLSHLLDENTLQKITENTWKKIWGIFLSFGNTSAEIIGIYFCIRTIKLIIDTVIHGYALHTIYGWSLHLIGAFWDSVTNLLLHLARKPPLEKEQEEDKGTSSSSSKLPQEIPNLHETLNQSNPQTHNQIHNNPHQSNPQQSQNTQHPPNSQFPTFSILNINEIKNIRNETQNIYPQL